MRGIGPVTLARLRPWLRWPDGASADGRRAGAGTSGLPDLNATDRAFLERLDGIGPELAKNILEERQRRRGFRAWPDVLETPGIGPAKLRVLQNATRLGEARPAAAVEPVRRRWTAVEGRR